MVKMIAWNIGQRAEAWRCLLDTDADIALLQRQPGRRMMLPASWVWIPLPGDGRSGAEPAMASGRCQALRGVSVQWLEAKPVSEARPGELAVSRPGTLAAAIVTPSTGGPFVVVSMYAPWEKPHWTTGSG